jgi:hypothetical protein
MRVPAFVAGLAGLLFCAGCGQKPEHPALAPACDQAKMNCEGNPGSGSGSGTPSGGGSDDNTAGAPNEGNPEVTGRVIEYGDDYFNEGTLLSTQATVSATGDGGARVTTSYDGKTFDLTGVALLTVNWFLVEPTGNGLLPTLAPVDTTTEHGAGLTLGVANTLSLDQIYLNSGTDRSTERAQLVVHVVDSQLRSVPGIRGTLTTPAEVVLYRMAGTWVPDDGTKSVTDDTGMLFFGNVQAGTGLTKGTLNLIGSGTAQHLDVDVKGGTVTVVNAILAGK